MEDLIGIILEHAGPIGVALCVLAFYLLHRFDMLPTFGRTRVRIEWADVQAEREKHKLTVIKGRSGGNEAA